SGVPGLLTLRNVTLRHNRAVGGAGNTAGTLLGSGFGGGLVRHGLLPGTTGTVSDSTIADIRALGGPGAAASHRGAGPGGGRARLFGAILTILGSTLTGNQALGSAGESGGNGFGGGLFNDGPSTFPTNPGAPTVLVAVGSTLSGNQATGGAGGTGAGGGIWS